MIQCAYCLDCKWCRNSIGHGFVTLVTQKLQVLKPKKKTNFQSQLHCFFNG